MNKNIMRKVGFRKEVDDVKLGRCPICNQDIKEDDFKDNLSIKEYKISGLCQKCQDETFGE